MCGGVKLACPNFPINHEDKFFVGVSVSDVESVWPSLDAIVILYWYLCHGR